MRLAIGTAPVATSEAVPRKGDSLIPDSPDLSAARIARASITAVRIAGTEDHVMDRVRRGSVSAFEQLYDRYADRGYRIARSICRDDGRAQEAVQEAFIAVWRSRAAYEDRGNVAAWVLTLVRYRAVDIARRNGPHATHRADEALLDTACASDAVADRVVDRAEARDLVRALDRLPEAQSEVIALAFYGQLTHPEIAAHLGVPIGTVKGRIRLGMKRMRSEIERRDRAA